MSVVSDMPKYVPKLKPVDVNNTESITRLSAPTLNSSSTVESVRPVSTVNGKLRLSDGNSESIGKPSCPVPRTTSVSAVPGTPRLLLNNNNVSSKKPTLSGVKSTKNVSTSPMNNVSVVSEIPKYVPKFKPVEVNSTESTTRLSEPKFESSSSVESVIPVSTANGKIRLSDGIRDRNGKPNCPIA